jgi:hypothetical protein
MKSILRWISNPIPVGTHFKFKGYPNQVWCVMDSTLTSNRNIVQCILATISGDIWENQSVELDSIEII